MADQPTYELAIVGGGIVGIVLAAGLVQRNIKVKLFEQARNFGEIGVGIGFTASTVRCMQQINPIIVEALRGGGAVHASTDSSDPNAYFRYLDGYLQLDPNDPSYQQPLYQLDAGPKGWETVRRDHFLMELVKKLPEDMFRLSSKLEHVEQSIPDGKVILKFADGTVYNADAVIACDGLKSKTRQLLLGAENPASYPQFSHKVAYRTLLPMDKVVEAIGEYKAHRLHFHLGPGAHVLHYPVNEKMIGSAVYISDPGDWPVGAPMTAWGVREDVRKVVAGWSEPVRKLVDLFPEKLEKWALFDMYEYPLKNYNFGRIALAGDAAHATSPHHGAGASFGVEDVLSLCTALDQTTEVVREKRLDKNMALTLALETYDQIRRRRTQWLVNSSRRTCDLYQQPEWADPARRVKAETCFEEVLDRSFKIWHFDSAEMAKETRERYNKLVDEKIQSLAANAVATAPAPVDEAMTPQQRQTDTTAVKHDWLAHIPDNKDMLPARIANLKVHMANLKAKHKEGLIIMGGPTLSQSDIASASQQPRITGSVQVLKASNELNAWEILKDDPYARLGVWNLDSASLQPMKVGILGLQG